MLFKPEVEAQLAYMERKLANNRKLLTSLPPGQLAVKNSNGKSYYYERLSGALHSLQKKPALLEKYLTKNRLLKENPALEKNIRLLRRVLSGYQPIALPDNHFASYEAEQHPGWSKEKRTLYQGVYYRSKSEAMIAAILTSYRIPFKYEVAYTLNGYQIYPDFLIERPRDKKIFIWEHFGKINDEEYDKKTFYRLQDYHNAGINLWENLIATFDQYDGGINVDYIDKIIKLYLL